MMEVEKVCEDESGRKDMGHHRRAALKSEFHFLDFVSKVKIATSGVERKATREISNPTMTPETPKSSSSAG